jgi:3-oxoacyl-[acyl-carrier protein] reductase
MRNVVVTGGSRGIGLGIATTLVAAGYRVIIIARNETEALQTLQRRATDGQSGAVHFMPFDLSDIDGIPKLVRSLRSRHGPIYGLVNNAAIGESGMLSLMPDHGIEWMIRLNVTSPIVLTKYIVKSMLANRAGRIVNISSIVAATGYKGLSAYSATKAALVGFTRSLAREVGPFDITVNAVAPGFIDTEMTHGYNPAWRDKIVARSAMHRMPQVEDVAYFVEHLLSDRARNVTGTVTNVDAGNTA